MNPGDEALRGDAGRGRKWQCQRTGRLAGASCHNCGGSGRIVKAIGA